MASGPPAVDGSEGENMTSTENDQLTQFEAELRVARMHKLRAERELENLERQAGFSDGARRLRKGLERAEQRLVKCEQTETDLLAQIEDLKNPKPKEDPEAEASEAETTEGEAEEPAAPTDSPDDADEAQAESDPST